MGLRTSALVALAGCLGWLIHPVAAFLVLGAAIAPVSLPNIWNLWVGWAPKTTTSVAPRVTLLLGMMVAQGHGLVAAAIAVLVTTLPAWKAELVRFTVGLSQEELRSIALFVWLTLMIYLLGPHGGGELAGRAAGGDPLWDRVGELRFVAAI
ncbi:MAG: hypothetical protein J7452_07020 [Thermoflexus sp.]|nr:hypothetical protein [Thermoflexus sp.]